MMSGCMAAALALGAQPRPARAYLPPSAGAAFELYPRHPRLVFRPEGDRGFGRTFGDVRELYRSDPAFRSIFEKAFSWDLAKQHPAMLAAGWIVSGDGRYADAAVGKAASAPIGDSGSGSYSDLWSFALAYDWLYDHPAMTAGMRKAIEAKLSERLASELENLDGTGMALWHGRNQAANGAMVAALAIGGLPGQEQNLRRAAAHYAQALRALDFSEGWPEGASYWIYNRAGPYAVAADCVLTALGTESIGGVSIRGAMRKIGLWTVYSFTPGGFFEPYGDSAGSLRLGETGWWELTADYFAKLSRDPGVMAGADYLRNRSPEPYGKRPYHWYMALAYDPSARPRNGYDPARPELWMREHLPQSMLFGRRSLGVAFFRGDWGDADELYATFKAGDLLAHHDHYDAGHFAIQRGGLLAPQTGLYGPGGGYYGPHRLGYAIQTVSGNSLLVLAPGETSPALRALNDPAWTSLSGGQRVIRPTGFDCVSLEHFSDLLRSGPHLERAEITAFESAPKAFDYIAADITAAYNSTRWAEPGNAAKVSLVTRQFVYLRPEQAFVTYDRVQTTSETYLPKFLLHSLSKPRSAREDLLTGSLNDGILQTSDRLLVTADRRGALTQIPLLPERARALKIGGPHFNCYVEGDGDQRNGFNGANLEGGDPTQPRDSAQLGLWRTEIEPLQRGAETRFLNVLLPRLQADPKPLPAVELARAGAHAHGAWVGDTVVVFAQTPDPLEEIALATNRPAQCLILDAHPNGAYRIGNRSERASGEGVLRVNLPRGSHRIRFAGTR
jgi:hypothetical protein